MQSADWNLTVGCCMKNIVIDTDENRKIYFVPDNVAEEVFHVK